MVGRHAGVAQNAGEQVIEIVRDAAGQPPQAGPAAPETAIAPKSTS